MFVGKLMETLNDCPAADAAVSGAESTYVKSVAYTSAGVITATSKDIDGDPGPTYILEGTIFR